MNTTELREFVRNVVLDVMRDELRRVARKEIERLRFPVIDRDVLTKVEVAALLNCGETTVKKLARAGKLARVGHDGKRTLICRESVERYLASRGVMLKRSAGVS